MHHTESQIDESTEQPRENATTSISLNESWSGFISVGDASKTKKQPKTYTLSLFTLHPQGDLKGIVFRNHRPIQDVRPFGVYSANKDALRSLKSLDYRLQKEYSDIYATGSVYSAATSSTSGHSSFSFIPAADHFTPNLSRRSSHNSASVQFRHPIESNRTLEYAKERTRASQYGDQDHSYKSKQRYLHGNNQPFGSEEHVDRLPSKGRAQSDSCGYKRGPSRESSVSSVISASGTRRQDLSRHHYSLKGVGESTKYFNFIEEEQATASKVATSKRQEGVVNIHAAPSRNSSYFQGKDIGIQVHSSILEKYNEEELYRIGEAVVKLGDGDGQKRNMVFQNVVQKICDVINSIVQNLPKNLFPFRFELLDKNAHFETKGLRAIEVYIGLTLLEHDNYDITFFEKENVLADVYVWTQWKDIEHFFVEDQARKQKKLSPCKLMIVFAHILNASFKARYGSLNQSKLTGIMPLPHGADVIHSNVTERLIQFKLKFPEEVSPYEVSLVLALDTKSFPQFSNLQRNRCWPDNSVKSVIESEGIHLLAKLGDKDLHSWTVSTLKARRSLLRLTDQSSNKLRVLLAFQTLRETELSRPQLLLPLHLATVLFWACVKYPTTSDWSEEKIGQRFLDLLFALRRCLFKGECRDFFFPFINLFEGQSLDTLYSVASKLDNIIKNPLKYLRRRVLVSDGEGDE